MILPEAFIILYSILIVFLCFGFVKVTNESTNFQKSSFSNPKTRFSIVIPFRNETENLERLLTSLAFLDYPVSLYEILLINDASTDDSVAVIEAFQFKSKLNLQILNSERFSGSPKKDALTRGIAKAAFEWIVTTDADCMVSSNWLKHLNLKIIQQDVSFIAGPVTFFENTGFLNRFQHLDFLSLQGATIGSFGLHQAFMCNGANLAFAKAEFLKLEGYSKSSHIASGDDVFLMQQFMNFDSKSVSYLKSTEALVYTNAQKSWKNLLQQRKRWAAKAPAYKSKFAMLTSILVLLGNASAVTAFMFFTEMWPFLTLKFLVDFILIFLTAQLFDQKKSLKNFLLIVWVYPFFTVYVAISSQFGKFEWKGRNFKR